MSGTLGARGHGGGGRTTDLDNQGAYVVGSIVDDGSARPLVARATGYRMDAESETLVVASPDRASDGHHGWSGPRGDGGDNLLVANPLDGGERGFAPRGDGSDNVLVVADPISAHEGKTYTHEGKHNFRTHNVVNGVRRLTPLECERLQGFPDGWTEVTAAGEPIADSHRYRMLGNAVATVVAQWLGHRLVAVDQWSAVNHNRNSTQATATASQNPVTTSACPTP